jgi:hypothetical protein
MDSVKRMMKLEILDLKNHIGTVEMTMKHQNDQIATVETKIDQVLLLLGQQRP